MGTESASIPVMIIAGEASGDVHGAALVERCRRKRPELCFFGMGGDEMERAGVEIIHHIRETSIVGFAEVVKRYLPIRRIFKHMVGLLKKRQPVLVILVDYPGFNLRFASRVRRNGILLVYYISPQVWAWGGGRIKAISRTVDRMLVFFPFEETIYKEAGVEVRFVGHPLKDLVRTEMDRNTFFDKLEFKTDLPTVGLLPGSRNLEVERLLPIMMESLSRLCESIGPVQAVLGKASSLDDSVYGSFPESISVRSLREQTYEIMAHSDVLIVASGTATLEAALTGTPMVIVYRIAPLSYRIARTLIKLPYVGLVNIVAGKKIVPELLQDDCSPEMIARTASHLITDRRRKDEMKRALRDVSRALGEPGAADRAAAAVLEVIDSSENRMRAEGGR